MAKKIVEKKIIMQYTEGQPPIAYIHLKESLKELKVGESVKQVVISKFGIDNQENLKAFLGEVVLDLDKNGKLVGIEIIGEVIPKNLTK